MKVAVLVVKNVDEADQSPAEEVSLILDSLREVLGPDADVQAYGAINEKAEELQALIEETL